MFRTR